MVLGVNKCNRKAVNRLFQPPRGTTISLQVICRQQYKYKQWIGNGNARRNYKRWDCSCRAQDAGFDRITRLREELSEAIDIEDYAKAAEIRDVIKTLSETARVQITEANAKFYEAFQARKLGDMRKIWASGNHIRVIHPGSGCIEGRDQVIASWEHIFETGQYRIDVEDVSIHTSGNVAFVTCVEYVDSGQTTGKIIATNIFENEDGEWRIVHHHGSPGVTTL